MKWYKQHDSMDCGPTCLRMVAKYYKKNVSALYLREKAQIGKEGVNLLGISEAAETIGFRTQALKLSFTTLTQEAKLPAILHWQQNHFVVLYKIAKNKLFLADPAKGLVTYLPHEFKANWLINKIDGKEEGIALLLEPSSNFYQINEERADDKEGLQFNALFNYVLPFKKLLVQLFIGLGVISLLQLILPFLTQSIVDTGVNTSNIHFIYIILMAKLALLAGRLVVEFVRSWILQYISTRINLSILTDFFIKLMKLPVSFFDSKHTGDIMQRISDHSRIESFLTGPSLSILFSFINLMLFSVILVIFNTYIFTVFLASSFLYTLWVIYFMKKRKQLDHRNFEIASQKQSATIQLIQGMQEIKLNGVEKPMRWHWESIQAKLFKLSIKSLKLNQYQQAGAFFITEGKDLFITFLAAKAVIDGQMTLGSMLAVQYIIGQLNSPVMQMISFLQSWQNAKISMERLNEIHRQADEEPQNGAFQNILPPAFAKQLVGGASYESTPFQVTPDLEEELSTSLLPVREYFEKQAVSSPKNELTNAGKEYSDDRLSIVFKNVSFTYPGAGNEAVLRDINLTLPIGKTTAIVGVSGSGKTTLLKLLLKFYDVPKGDIKLNNTSLSIISHRVWRSHCGVVMQDSFIFSDTIARNIAVGIEKMNLDRLNHAADVANIRDFIEDLPLGFNTKIGAEGIGISMGQRQRILIARAVYRNPNFIFFDEATNSLDANNESVIVNNLQHFFKGRTVVVVAHRLSTVKNADQIIVLNNGCITERGTHSELVNLKGDYFKLVRNQLDLGA